MVMLRLLGPRWGTGQAAEDSGAFVPQQYWVSLCQPATLFSSPETVKHRKYSRLQKSLSVPAWEGPASMLPSTVSVWSRHSSCRAAAAANVSPWIGVFHSTFSSTALCITPGEQTTFKAGKQEMKKTPNSVCLNKFVFFFVSCVPPYQLDLVIYIYYIHQFQIIFLYLYVKFIKRTTICDNFKT